MRAKSIAIVIIVIATIVGASFAALYITTYNNLVTLKVATDQQWAQVETVLQRKYDLIPQLINVTDSYLHYEASVLQNITQLRTQWNSAITSGNQEDINNATAQMEAGIAPIIISVEAYPGLTAQTVVHDLMVSLESAENMIATERLRFNDAVAEYNSAIMVFPANMLAPGWGFTAKSYFQSEAA